MVHLTVCYYNVTYTFQSESRIYSYLNVKELLARNRRDIWSLSDNNEIRTHNHLVRQRTVSSKEHLDIQSTIECRFTLKCVRDITYSQLHRTDKYSQHSSIIWSAWLNGWALVYEQSGCGFESCCCHLRFTFHTCFEQEVPWHFGNYRV